MAVYITGDIHSEIYPRFSSKNFPEQKDMTKNDYVIVCGDFGIPWNNGPSDRYAIRELEKRNFTTLFIDGNHENYDILNGYPVETWNGGKIHRISDSIIHLMRGQMFHIEDHDFFTFGGAASHDIYDGIIENDEHVKENVKKMKQQGKRMYRINHVSWWAEEMPTDEDFDAAVNTLHDHQHYADFIITHDAPTCIKRMMHHYECNFLTNSLQYIYQTTDFKRWYFGHMHVDTMFVHNRSIAVYEKIHRIL